MCFSSLPGRSPVITLYCTYEGRSKEAMLPTEWNKLFFVKRSVEREKI